MAARTPKAVKNQSGLTINAKMHLAEKAKHALRIQDYDENKHALLRFAACVNGVLTPLHNAPKIVHTTKRRVNMDFTLNEEFSNNDLDFTTHVTGTLHAKKN